MSPVDKNNLPTSVFYKNNVIVAGYKNGYIDFFCLNLYKLHPYAELVKRICPPSQDKGLQVPLSCLSISQCFKFLAVGTVSGMILVFEISEETVMKIVHEHEMHKGNQITSLTWSLDSSILYSGCSGGLIVELKCKLSFTSQPLSFATSALFGNKSTSIIFKNKSPIYSLESSIIDTNIGLVTLVIFICETHCYLLQIPHSTLHSVQLVDLSGGSDNDSSSDRSSSSISDGSSGRSKTSKCLICYFFYDEVLGTIIGVKHVKTCSTGLQILTYNLLVEKDQQEIESIQAKSAIDTKDIQSIDAHGLQRGGGVGEGLLVGRTGTGLLIVVDTKQLIVEVLRSGVPAVRQFGVCGDNIVLAQEDGQLGLLLRATAPSSCPLTRILSAPWHVSVCRIQRRWRKRRLKMVSRPEEPQTEYLSDVSAGASPAGLLDWVVSHGVGATMSKKLLALSEHISEALQHNMTESPSGPTQEPYYGEISAPSQLAAVPRLRNVLSCDSVENGVSDSSNGANTPVLDEYDSGRSTPVSPFDSWVSVGELTWREQWWGEGDQAAPEHQLLRLRVTSRDRWRQRYEQKQAEALLAAVPKAISSPGHPFYFLTNEMLSVMPNTYEIRLKPKVGMGLGLQLSVVSGGCVAVRGFTRSSAWAGRGAGTISDTRGEAERSGVICAGDMLLSVDDLALSQLGLEQLVEVVRSLESMTGEEVRLRFMYGDSAVLGPASAGAARTATPPLPSKATLFEEEFALLDAFNPAARRDLESFRVPSPLRKIQIGLEAWLDGDVEQSSFGELDEVHNRESEAVISHLRNKSLYPVIYPSPCMQQRGEPSVARILPKLAEEARVWVVAMLPGFFGLATRRRTRLDVEAIRDGSKRRGKGSCEAKGDVCGGVGTVTVLSVSAYEASLRALLAEGTADVYSSRKGSQTLSCSRASKAVATDGNPSGNLLRVRWRGVAGRESDRSAPDLDPELWQLRMLLFGVEDRGGAATASRSTFGMTAALGLTVPVQDIAKKSMPPLSLSQRLKRTLLGPQISLLLEPAASDLLSSWLHSFKPLPSSQRHLLRPAIFTSTNAATLGFQTAGVMSDSVAVTELLVTLHLLLHSVWPWLRCSTGTSTSSTSRSEALRAASSHSRFCHFLRTVGLELSYSQRQLQPEAGMPSLCPSQWADEEMCRFVSTYAAYLDLDTVALVFNVRHSRPASLLFQELVLLDRVLLQHCEELRSGSVLEKFMSSVADGYAGDISAPLCLVQLQLKPTVQTDIDLGCAVAVAMFPCIRPSTVRELFQKPDERSKTGNGPTRTQSGGRAEDSRAYWRYLHRVLGVATTAKGQGSTPANEFVTSCCRTDRALVLEYVELCLESCFRGSATAALDLLQSSVLDYCRTVLRQPDTFQYDFKQAVHLCQHYFFCDGVVDIVRGQLALRSSDEAAGGEQRHQGIEEALLWCVSRGIAVTRYADVAVLALRLLWVALCQNSRRSVPEQTEYSDEAEIISKMAASLESVFRSSDLDRQTSYLCRLLHQALGASLTLALVRHSDLLLASLDQDFFLLVSGCLN